MAETYELIEIEDYEFQEGVSELLAMTIDETFTPLEQWVISYDEVARIKAETSTYQRWWIRARMGIESSETFSFAHYAVHGMYSSLGSATYDDFPALEETEDQVFVNVQYFGFFQGNQIVCNGICRFVDWELNFTFEGPHSEGKGYYTVSGHIYAEYSVLVRAVLAVPVELPEVLPVGAVTLGILAVVGSMLLIGGGGRLVGRKKQ